MATITYTVINPSSGEPEGRNLDAWDAAQIVLGHDGHDYEVRRLDDCWQLFVSRGSRNSAGGNRGLTEAWAHFRLVASHHVDEQAALADIGRQVCEAGWERVPTVYTDAAYDAEIAEIAS